MSIAACLGMLLLCPLGAARAQVLVLGQPYDPLNKSLLETLRIQLSNSEVGLSYQVLRSHDTTTEQEARRMLDGQQTRLVVWVASAGETTHQLHLMRLRGTSAEMSVVEVTGPISPALERSIALIVRAALDELDTTVPPARMTHSTPARATPPPVAPGKPRPKRETPRVPSTVARPGSSSLPIVVMGEIGARAATPGGNVSWQGGIGGAAGLALRLPADTAQLCLGLHWASPFSRQSPLGRIDTTELIAELSLRGLHRVGDFWVGPFTQFGLRLVTATGVDGARERGERLEVVPAVAAGGETQIPLSGPLWLRCALGIEVALKAQSFAVEEHSLLRLGRMRGVAALSVVILPR